MATILVLDDQNINREFLSTLLGYAGHRIVQAGNGAEALALTRAEHPDLVIADLLMPGMDGYQFVRELRDDREIAQTPVMFYSAFYQESEGRELARSCGVRHLLSKPSDPEVILQTVKTILENSPERPRWATPEEFGRQHSRLLTDRLCYAVDGLNAANDRLLALLAIGQQLAAEHDGEQVIERLCSATREILGCVHAGAVTFDGFAGPRSLALTGPENEPSDRLRNLLLDNAVLDRICADKSVKRMLDLGAGQPHDHGSLLGVPLMRPFGPLGVLICLDKIGAPEFTAEDEQVAATIAAQAAVAYENAMRYRDIRRHAADLERQIAERRKIEQALREQEESFRTLFEEAPVGLLLSGLDHKLLRANRACGAILGYRGEDISRLHLEDLVCREDLHKSLQTTQELIDGNGPAVNLDMRWLGKGNEAIWAQVTVALIRGSDGTPLQCLHVLQDITERKKRDDEIRGLNRQLAQNVAELTALNQDLEVFTYSIAHDLRAPLRHIDGFSRILLQQLDQKLEPASHGYLQRVREGSQHMGRMIDDLLKHAQTGRRTLNMHMSDLKLVIDDVMRYLRPDTDGRSVDWRIGDLPPVECDASLMRQVFANLLDNAVKFSRSRNPAIIEVGEMDADGEHVFFVRDNGVGFSMKYAEKLFGVFQRLHSAEQFDGSGVGLATVQRIIRKHGGRIWAESEENGGATFFFTLGSAAPVEESPRDPVLQPEK